MSKELAQLAKKIATISKEIGKVDQDGINTFDKYKFISHEQTTTILRTLLEKNNIAIFPSVESYEEKNTLTATGKQQIRTIVTMKFLIVDTETGYSIEKTFTGADQDQKGKSMGQAITEAVKRFELKLFHITSKDDIDPDSKGASINPRTKSEIFKDISGAIAKNPELKVKIAELKNGKDTNDLTLDELQAIWEQVK